MFSLVRVCVSAVAVILCFAPDASAQGVTTAAVRGRVIDDAGAPVDRATVVLMNTRTGQRYQTVSREDGRYTLENVAVGGPYTLSAQRIGFRVAERTGIILTLGQIVSYEVRLPRAAVPLDAIIVTAWREQDPLATVSRTGTAALVTDSAVSRLPSINRNFTDFVITAPQVASAEGLSLGGGHRKMNNIQIDGVSDNDLFGLGDTGQPGGQVDAKSITLEAVKEFQVLIAPFDVRQNGFAGGLINAVTKRGTNAFHGSAFWYYQTEGLVRDTLTVFRSVSPTVTDTLKYAFGEFLQHQRGLSLSGPLLKDKLHFYGAAEWQQREVPFGPFAVGVDPATVTRIQPDTAQRVKDIFRTAYGVDIGSFGALKDESPNRNIFGRLDLQLGGSHAIALRHNHVLASSDVLSRSSSGYAFSSYNYTIRSKTNSTVLQLNSSFGEGRFYNELRLGYTSIRDRRKPEDPLNRDAPVTLPHIEVRTNSNIGGTTVFNQFNIGRERFSQRNELDQEIFELDDALTFGRGAHTLTVGTHNEWIHFRNLFHHTRDGQWRFNSLADLQAGRASLYFVQLPYDSTVRRFNEADWGLVQLGGYVQDQWEITPAFRLTVGLRVDVPVILDDPVFNPGVDSAFSGLRTDRMPGAKPHWSPRLGMNWDITGNRSTVVRGGVGLFTGRPPYVWVSNAFTNTGREVLQLTCTGTANTPAFTPSVFTNPPTACRTPSPLRLPASEVNVFDPDFKFPQYLKTSLAIDQRLPWDMVGTVEFLYSRGVNTIYQEELNLQPSTRRNREGRLMFGTINAATGIATPTRVSAGFVQVLNHANRSEDWTYSLALEVQKRFSDGVEFGASYAYSKGKDLTALTSSIATSNFGFSPISKGGDPNDRELATSRWVVPHKVTLNGTVDIPIPSFPTSLTLLYVGQSGLAYTWTVDGDANADGYEAANISGRNNDIVYVPRDASDFTGQTPADFMRYDSLIQSEPCLQEARGTIPARNTCRNPWRNRLDANLRISFGQVFGGQEHRLSLVADVFNVLNLLNEKWGLQREVLGFESDEALELVGYDAANDRGIYRYIASSAARKESYAILSSRWRAQVGLRYDF